MTTTHDQVAREIALGTDLDTIPTVDQLAHQGDVRVLYVGPPADGKHDPTPDFGVQIAAGKHGEHRLIGPAVRWIAKGRVSLRVDALIVHTDVPDARHGTIRLRDGTWEYCQARELDAASVIRKVED